MLRRTLLLITIMLASLACLVSVADAAGYQPSVSTLEHANGIIYYRNGSVASGPVNGTLTVRNPALLSPLSAVNVTMPNGSTAFIGRIDPSSSYNVDYSANLSGGAIPLKLKETITPASLTVGVRGQVRLCVEAENTGSGDITGFVYQKALPPGLGMAWESNTGGTLTVNDTVTWALGTLKPGEKQNIAIALDLTPSSSVYFPEASVKFSYCKSLAGNASGFTGNTDTSFSIQKSHPGTDLWHVEASVPGDSEFTINLKNVVIYRSSASDPFNASPIASYAPGISLDPGCSWDTALDDSFGEVPAYFIKTSYAIPYTVEHTTALQGRTEPVTIGVYSPTATPDIPYRPPAIAIMPSVTPSPTASPPPLLNPDIVFIAPTGMEAIVDNTTWLEVSAPPSGDTDYVVFYGSADNETWVRIGESPVTGNLSGLIWTVPQLNGKYYLKAEHYNPWGLRGVAYIQVLIAHEILPVDLSTMLMQGQDLLVFPAMAMAGLLLLLIFVPFFRKRPVVYDMSALIALGKDKGDEGLKLSDKAIRPDKLPPGMEYLGRLKAVKIKNVGEVARLEREYALAPYDAMAIALAKDTGAMLYSYDARIVEICKSMGIKVEQPGSRKT